MKQNDGIDENEVNLVNNPTDAAVANAVVNGMMHHPDVPQDSQSVSYGAQAFFRAQGIPVTLELPLPSSTSANRIIHIPRSNDISVDDDSAIRRLAARMGLHQCFGPSPPVEMLVQDLVVHAHSLLVALPMKEPLLTQSWNFVSASSYPNTWLLCVDNPRWGNNAEASSSSGARRPRLVPMEALLRIDFASNNQSNSTASSLCDADPDLNASAIVPVIQEFAD
jgi:hypothetical protein